MGQQVLVKDADIRRDLVAWLIASHRKSADVRICHEFKIRSRGARADVVLLNGEMAGYEIKSDADTVARLARQIDAFSAVLDKVSVVTTAKNLDKVAAIAPVWCGVILYEPESEQKKFSVVSKAHACPPRDKRELAALLSSAELRLALQKRGKGCGLSKADAAAVVDAFVSRLSAREQKRALLSALKERVDFREEMAAKYGIHLNHQSP